MYQSVVEGFGGLYDRSSFHWIGNNRYLVGFINICVYDGALCVGE